jgi:single-strand DNA-binding protein
MSSLNRVMLIGNLGSDPESRSMNNGGTVVSFRLACSESWKDKSGTRQEKTEWVPVVIFNEALGKVASQYLRKGSKCYVSGKFQTRKWQDNSGADRYTTEVVVQQFGGELVLLDSRREPDGSQGHGGQTAGHDDFGDDVPFARNDTVF